MDTAKSYGIDESHDRLQHQMIRDVGIGVGAERCFLTLVRGCGSGASEDKKMINGAVLACGCVAAQPRYLVRERCAGGGA